MTNELSLKSNDFNFNKIRFSLVTTTLFLIIVSYVAFIIDEPTQDADLLFYFYNGYEIIFENNLEIALFNAPIGLAIVLAGLNYFVGEPFITGKILSVIFSSGIVFISYFILRNLFNTKIAMFGQVLLAINPILHHEAIISHLEMLPTFLIFLSLYFITKKQLIPKNLIFCAIFLGISFMIRYQSIGIFFGIAIFLLLFSDKRKKSLFLFFMFFLIAISPLLILNLSIHGTPIASDADFYLGFSSGSYENQFQELESDDNSISDLGILEKYYLNFSDINSHIIFNTDNGYNNLAPITFIPYIAILFIESAFPFLSQHVTRFIL